MESSKKTTVKLFTFQTWNVTYIGYKSELKEGVAYVSQVWCKVCASNKGKLYERHAVKGATEAAAESFANGTDFTTKHLVQIFDFDRHIFFKN